MKLKKQSLYIDSGSLFDDGIVLMLCNFNYGLTFNIYHVNS